MRASIVALVSAAALAITAGSASASPKQRHYDPPGPACSVHLLQYPNGVVVLVVNCDP